MIKLIAIQLFAIATAFLGADHEDGLLIQQPGWPKGLHTSINSANRVHGFWVNTTDVFFYRGEAEQINAMTESLAELDAVSSKMVLHAGSGVAKSPWGTNKGMANWSVTSYCKAGFGKQDSILIDVWIGNGVELKELEIPDSIQVENGGEIESFIESLRTNSNK